MTVASIAALGSSPQEIVTHWSTRQESSISRESLGDVWAVHLDGNGMTHLVDPVSAEVLSFVGISPRTLAAIRGFVAEYIGDPAASESEVQAQLLLPLEEVGLLETFNN